MKRSLHQLEGQNKTRKNFANSYDGSVVNSKVPIPTVENLDGFYAAHVKTRTPAKIILDANHPVNVGDFSLKHIVGKLAYPADSKLQVERKTAFGFGLGKTRELMPFAEIVQKLESGDDSYYLTTQYDEHDVLDAASEEDLAASEEDLAASDLSDGESPNPKARDGNDNNESSEEEIGEDVAGFEDISETSSLDSFDMNDLHDDFESIEDEEFVDEELKLTEEEANDRVRSLYQAPLTELVKSTDFPVTPKPFAALVPQQINLWMGLLLKRAEKPNLLAPTKESLGKYVPEGNSSGLHHDHADNLYVLTQGRKRFTLYSPKDADKLFTVGDINTVYPNGLIDYKINKNARFWRRMREDGSLAAEYAAWLLEKEDYSEFEKEELEKMVEEEEAYDGDIDLSLDPPSFSTVPPILAHLDELTDEKEIASLTKFANEKFPGFLELQKTEIFLEAGDMLYLPCGWFHEVTSYADEVLTAHIAMNWWFMPPNGESESEPYKDEYWKQDYAKTRRSIEHIRLQ